MAVTLTAPAGGGVWAGLDRDEFTRQYAALVPVSPERVALWEAVDLLTCVLHSWTKVQPRRLVTARLLLERHLVAMGL
jgi:hypothetical protein